MADVLKWGGGGWNLSGLGLGRWSISHFEACEITHVFSANAKVGESTKLAFYLKVVDIYEGFEFRRFG